MSTSETNEEWQARIVSSLPCEPYYVQDGIIIVNSDCRDILPHLPKVGLVLTDPPYNIGYHYEGGGDTRPEQEYLDLLSTALRVPSVVICYPEISYKISWLLEEIPARVCAWCYPSNTPRNWRSVAWFGVAADPESVEQPYKNPSDRRIQERISNGEFARGYDWKIIPQVKNVSEEKTCHPCQNPVGVMEWALLATPNCDIVIDPFMGSGTTLVAAKKLNRRAIGIEIEEKYCAIAVKRLAQGVLGI